LEKATDRKKYLATVHPHHKVTAVIPALHGKHLTVSKGGESVQAFRRLSLSAEKPPDRGRDDRTCLDWNYSHAPGGHIPEYALWSAVHLSTISRLPRSGRLDPKIFLPTYPTRAPQRLLDDRDLLAELLLIADVKPVATPAISGVLATR
jgi:hypothetical protein